MNAAEIYKLATEITEQEINNVLNAWEMQEDAEKIRAYNSLVRLGDRKELAMATIMINGVIKAEY